jgi:cell division protein FtsX
MVQAAPTNDTETTINTTTAANTPVTTTTAAQTTAAVEDPQTCKCKQKASEYLDRAVKTGRIQHAGTILYFILMVLMIIWVIRNLVSR